MQEATVWLNFTAAVGLIVIGIAGLVLSRHLFRMVLALAIAEAGANLLLVQTGFVWHADAPILIDGVMPQVMVDPVPQALVLTSIVIGVGVQALALALAVRIWQHYGTLDRREVHSRLEHDIANEAGAPLLGSEDKPLGGRPLPLPHPQPVFLRTAQSADSGERRS